MMLTVVKTKKSPYYQAKIRLLKGTKPIWKSTGERNRALAVKAAEKIAEELAGNPHGSSKAAKITIAEFCRLPVATASDDRGGEYWQYLLANKAGTTRDRASDILRTQIIPVFGTYRFEEVSPLLIEKWKQQRLKDVSRATVKKELDTLSNVYRIARKIYRYTRFNPVEDIERPTVPKKKTRVPSAVEIQRFFEVCAAIRPGHFPILLTTYSTGARIDEVRHLEPADVLLNDGRIAFRVKPGWSPKDAEDRDAPLVEPLRSVLVRVLASHSGGKWLLQRIGGRTIHCKRCGVRTNHFGNMRKTIRYVATVAGISQRTTHHILRHCANTHVQQLGSKQHVAMELLGQQTTQVNRLYTHAEWPEVVEAAQRLGQSVGENVVGIWVGVGSPAAAPDITT